MRLRRQRYDDDEDGAIYFQRKNKKEIPNSDKNAVTDAAVQNNNGFFGWYQAKNRSRQREKKKLKDDVRCTKVAHS